MSLSSVALSPSFVPRTELEPRLWTPSLRELTPATSYGFDVIRFARDVLKHPLDPWQEWLAIHAGELLPDGRPRFRQVLVLVARQNGKTELLVVLALFWQFVQRLPLTLGTSTKTAYAKESLTKSVKLAEATPELNVLRPKVWTRNAAGEEQSFTSEGCRYMVAASNAEGGRSLTINRLILDELRQHHTYSAWDASVPATMAVRDGQVWAITNAGDDNSVVLNDLRANAMLGEDPRLGHFEWSAPEGSDPLDPAARAMANPSHRLDVEALESEARRAVAIGGDALAGFLTEHLCIRVKQLDAAVDPGAWQRCLDPGDLTSARSRVALAVDVAPDQQHATLAAAAVLTDGRVRVEVVAAWDGPACTDRLRRDLPELLERIRPQSLGWLPAGPAAVLAADLAERKGRTGWPPPGVTVAEIRGETAATCMAFAELVVAGQIAHSGDPLLDAHVSGAERLRRGDSWVFSRRGGGHCDALYAAAGATHLSRTLPTAVGKPRLIVAGD